MNTIFYFAYLFATLVLGNLRIGPFSLRVYMNVIMAVYLFFSQSKRSNIKDANIVKFVIVYCIYIFVTTVILLLDGDFVPYNFSKMLLANYFPSIVLIFATLRYANNEIKMKNILAFLLIVITIDSIVTIMQSYGSLLGMQLAQFFNNTAESRANVDEIIGSSDKMIDKTGYGFASGFFNYAFINSLYISSSGLFALYFLREEKKGVFRVIYWIILLLTIYACFLTQERISIVTMLIASLILIIYHGVSSKSGKMFFVLGIVALMIFGQGLVNTFNFGRAFQISLQEDSRSYLWAVAIDYISDNFLLGGPIGYYNIAEMAPHNFFLNALILSGAIGGSLIIGLFIWQLFCAIKNIINKNNNFCLVVVSLSVLLAFAYSLFHNAGLYGGDSMTILLVTMMIQQKKIMNTRDSENELPSSITTDK